MLCPNHAKRAEGAAKAYFQFEERIIVAEFRQGLRKFSAIADDCVFKGMTAGVR